MKHSKQKTRRSPNIFLGEFQIYHLAKSYPQHREIMNLQVRIEAYIDTDHYLNLCKIITQTHEHY